MTPLRSSGISFAALLLSSSAAHAQRVTAPAGAFVGTATVEVNVSSDAVGEPVSIAPDLSYGASDRWTVSLVHSTFAMTGFRGSAGRGVCVTGEDGGCPAVYDAAGLEAAAGLSTGTWATAAFAGVHAVSLDEGFWSVRAGARVRWTQGRLALQTVPSVLVAVTGRDQTAPDPSNVDRLYVPLAATYQVIEPLTLGAGTGLKGPIDGLGDSYEISLGAYAQYAFDPRTHVGASCTFGKLIAGDAAIPEGSSGADFRAVHVWVGVTR